MGTRANYMKIAGIGKRILQIDANDHLWGSILIEEVRNKICYCGYASRQFKDSEKHYHTTFIDALAVKNGVKKFDFHLRGNYFELQMDNLSFPKILEFNNKMSPNPQIFRLKDWFSHYDFNVKHIKGNHNVMPNFLSRPPKPLQMITKLSSFPLIFMVKSLPNKAKTVRNFPPRLSICKVQIFLLLTLNII